MGLMQPRGTSRVRFIRFCKWILWDKFSVCLLWIQSIRKVISEFN